MKISLNDIRLFAYHGVDPQETHVGAWFRTSLEADVDCPMACTTDNLDDTVNYAEMAAIVKAEMATPSKLLEHVAYRIARKLLDTFPQIKALKVTVVKENPPIGMECSEASVTLNVGR